MKDLRINVIGSLSAQKRIQALELPPRKRRQLLGGIGRELKRQSIRNLRAGRDVDGRPWEPRKRGSNRKLLRRLNRQVAANLLTPDYVDVGYRGAVAYQQHEGMSQVMTGAKMQSESGHRDHYEEPATRKQAKELRAEGYKVRVKGTKKWRRPSLKWITENLKQKQAGLILRTLREEKPKRFWVTKLPARPFLGATEYQISQFIEKIYDNTINSRV